MTDSATHLRLDAHAITVLAHPLRSRLVSTLRIGGPATATALARALDTNSGATSYHLRRLAEVGLVIDTGEGDGKSRVWAAAGEATQIVPSDVEGDADAETALGWLERDWLRHLTDKLGRWLDLRHLWPVAWRDAASLNDAMVLVTPEQLTAMQSEIDGIVARYARVGAGNPEAKRVAAYAIYYPVDLDKAPRR